jgi:AraC family transcriptional activator of pobA
MMKNIKHYNGVYGDTTHKRVDNYIFSELLETNSKHFNWTIEPHIHSDLFQITYVKTGNVQFHGLAQSIDLPIPCIFVVPPMTLHGYNYSTDTTRHVLTFSDALVETIFDNLGAVAPAIRSLKSPIY